jgi:hypothetical protein
MYSGIIGLIGIFHFYTIIFLFKASYHIWQNLAAYGLKASDLINNTVKNQTTYCTGRHTSTELSHIKSCHGEHRKTWYREQDISWMIG